MALKGKGNEVVHAEPRTAPNAVRAWGPAAWTVWTVSVVCGVFASLLASFLMTWKAGPNCGNLATSANVRSGIAGLGTAALVLAAPWMFAVFLASRRWRPMVIGLSITVLPLVVVAATHTHAADWNGGGFCF
jgi:hypothetical protein